MVRVRFGVRVRVRVRYPRRYHLVEKARVGGLGHGALGHPHRVGARVRGCRVAHLVGLGVGVGTGVWVGARVAHLVRGRGRGTDTGRVRRRGRDQE